MKKFANVLVIVSLTTSACGTDPAFKQVPGSQSSDQQADSPAPKPELGINKNAMPLPLPVTDGGGLVALPSGDKGKTLSGGTPKTGTSPGMTGPTGAAPSAPILVNGPTPVAPNGTVTAAPSPPVDVLHPEKPVVPEGKTLLQLKVQQLQSQSWYKNCLSLSLNGKTQTVGCNKDADSIGRWIYLIADKPPICNHIKVTMDTYYNYGSDCAKNAPAGASCQGPYRNTPDRTRTPLAENDKEFFKVYDASTVDNHDALIVANFDWLLLKKDMVNFAASGNSSWLRIFFEDLSKDVLDKARESPNSANSMGINFNDYIFDIKGQDVDVNIDGTSVGC